MLLAFRRDEDGSNGQPNRALFGSIAALVALIGMAVIDIADSGSDIGPKPFGIVSVLYLLSVLLAPLLRHAEILET